MSAQRSRRTEIVINFIFFVFVQLAIPSSTTGDGASGSRVADVNDDKQNHHQQQQQQHLASIEDEGHVLLDSAMENTTCFEWDTVRIKCDITGYPLPRYKWYKDGNPLDSPKAQLHLSVSSSSGPINLRRFDIKTTPWGSRLRLSNVTVRDAGVYTCEGFNQFGRQVTSGRLTVKQGSNPNRNSRHRQSMESEDDEDQFDQDAHDDMLKWPSIERRRVLPPDGAVQVDMGAGLPSLHANPPFSETTSSRTSSGKFSGNRNAYGERDEDGSDGAGHDVEADDDDAGLKDGTCQLYQGSTCSRFVDNRSVYSWRGRKQSQLEDQLIALLKTSTRLSAVCFDHLIPTLCYVAFPLCRADPAHSGGGGRDNRRGRGPRRRPMSGTRGRRPMCDEDCRSLDEHDCRTEYKALAAAAALATTGSSRRQLQSFSELLQLSWCRSPSEVESTQHQLDNDCAHFITKNIQRSPSNVTIDSASPQLDHDYQLQRALTVVIPCAIVPLLVALLLIVIRRCRRIQDHQHHQQRAAASAVTVKKDTVRVVSVNGSTSLQCKTEQWPRRGVPGLSHADFVCGWSPTHNENGTRRIPPTAAGASAPFADASTTWNVHRVYTSAPGGQHHLGASTPSHNVQRHQIHHDLPPYPVRHQIVAPVHPPEMPSSTILQPHHPYHPYHHHHATRYSVRRPGTPASGTTSGGGHGDGRSATQKQSPTASLSTDLYGIGGQHHQLQYHQHLPVGTSCVGFDSGAWSASSTQQQCGGRRTPTGSDRSTGGFDRGCPA